MILIYPRFYTRTLDTVGWGIRLLLQRDKHSTQWGVERLPRRLARLLSPQGWRRSDEEARRRRYRRFTHCRGPGPRPVRPITQPNSRPDPARPPAARTARVPRTTRRDAGPVEDDQEKLHRVVPETDETSARRPCFVSSRIPCSTWLCLSFSRAR